MAFANRDLTDIHEFTRDELVFILDRAAGIKRALRERDVGAYRLAGNRDLLAALLFYESSTRTRTSFEIAAMRLGMRVTGFAKAEGTSVDKGESLRHTLDMYEAYQCDALIMRHPLDGSARFAAEHLGIPVFNAGDGKHEHPTQTLLDLFTIREHHGRLEDLDIGLAGDLKYGRTVHSLVVALAKFDGIRLHLFSHEALAMPEALLAHAREYGLAVKLHDDLGGLAQSCDVLYQTRIQAERMPDLSEFDKAKAMSCFTLEMLEGTRERFGLMHPLPIDKAAPSIPPAVDRHPKAIYKEQAGNGVPTRLVELALALGLMGDDFAGEVWQPPVVDESFIEERPITEKAPRTDVSILPIRKSGVVVDHMRPYAEEVLVGLLGIRERRDVYRAATVTPRNRPGVVKGMLMIENRSLTGDELRAVAAISPGCTVNFIEGAKVRRKLRMRMPPVISGIPGMICPNRGCITRPEQLEAVPPVMLSDGSGRVRCRYCDNLMESIALA